MTGWGVIFKDVNADILGIKYFKSENVDILGIKYFKAVNVIHIKYYRLRRNF